LETRAAGKASGIIPLLFMQKNYRRGPDQRELIKSLSASLQAMVAFAENALLTLAASLINSASFARI
jgi:hypothetical protein